MPKPRTASLRVGHQRGCPNQSRTALDSLDGCRCKPAYYTFHRDRSGRPIKGPRVRDRQVADRALNKLLVALDEDRADVGPRRRDVRTFDAWADEYLGNLERDKGNKSSTIRSYESTFNYARPIVGKLELDEIGQPELRLIVRAIRARKDAGSDATVFKHLRHLRATFTAAVEEGYASRNPLSRKFINDLRLDVPNNVESYTDDELAKLFAKMDALDYDPVYVFVAKAALATGARVGELIAADWDHLRLSERELQIDYHYDGSSGKRTLPKDGEARTNYLFSESEERACPDAINGVRLFERWTELVGVQPGDAPIFPAPRGDRLNGQYVAKLVNKARRKAGIPDNGEGGRKRKPIHALRGSYTRMAREAGFPTWLIQHNLGHSTPLLTENVYGRIGRDALHVAARGETVLPA
jgi:integrase